jgi:hypothetical protein
VPHDFEAFWRAYIFRIFCRAVATRSRACHCSRRGLDNGSRALQHTR